MTSSVLMKSKLLSPIADMMFVVPDDVLAWNDSRYRCPISSLPPMRPLLNITWSVLASPPNRKVATPPLTDWTEEFP